MAQFSVKIMRLTGSILGANQHPRKHRPESMPPKPHRFVAYVDATLVQHVLHIAKRQREPDVEHYRKANDFGAGLEIAKGAAFCHPTTLGGHHPCLKPVLL